MSGVKDQLLAWATDQQQLDVASKFVLYRLAQFADGECCAWAKVDTLAFAVNVSARTIQYRLRDLEAAGLIRRTERVHRLEGSTRTVPIYQVAPEAEGLGLRQSMGAKSAPIDPHGCRIEGGMGAKGLHPHKELTGTEDPSGEGSMRAGEREALFGRLEAAFAKRGLGFTHRERAWGVFGELLDEGLDAERLILAAAAYAADPSVKRKDLGLDHWLADRKYRGWWPEPAAVAEAAVGVALPDHAAGEAWQAIWRTACARLEAELGAGTFGSWLRPAFLGEQGGALYVVAATGMAHDWIRDNGWKRVLAAWSAATGAAPMAPLTLISRARFQALNQGGN
jgi:hypothetical protein